MSVIVASDQPQHIDYNYKHQAPELSVYINYHTEVWSAFSMVDCLLEVSYYRAVF